MATQAGGIKIVRDLNEITNELKKLNKEFKASSKEAKNLDKALKLDPGNKLVATQRYKELGAQIETCTKQLDLLNEKKNALDAKGTDKTTEEYRKLENQIAVTTAQLNNLNKQADKLNSINLNKLTDRLKTISKICFSVLGTIAGLGKAYASSADAIQKQIDKFGGTAEEWQLNSNAWDKVTGDSSAYESVLSAVTSNLSQVQKESAKVGKVLDQLGLTFDDLKNKSSTDALNIYIEALRAVGDEATRQNLAVALFGEAAGLSVTQMANTSASAIAQYNAEMEQAGLLTSEQVQAGAELQDTFDYLKQTIMKLVADLGFSFKPMIETIVNLIKGIAPIIKAIGSALAAIGPGGAVAIAVFGTLIGILPTLVTMMSALKMSTGDMVTAIAAMSLLALTSAISIGGIVSGLTSKSNTKSASVELAPVDYTTLQAEAAQTESNNNNSQSSSSASGNTVVNNYYDNSTMNNNIDSSVDYEEMIEYINDKKRVQIGG